MSFFLYYIPKLGGLNDEGLRRAGLFERVGPSRDVTPTQIAGPDGGRGILFRDAQGGPFKEPLVFNGEAQVWRKEVVRDHQVLASGELPMYWLGFWKANPPGPENLKRYADEEMFEGYDIQLGDRRTWTIPRGRIFDAGMLSFSTPWPSEFVYDAAGNLARSVSRDFRAHEELMKLAIGASEPMKVGDFDLLALRILEINYRLGANEGIALALVNTRKSREILHAFLDFPAIAEQLEQEKKSQAAEGPGNIGDTNAGDVG